ncbi:hypothetical protein GCM10012288_20940 [Malaciobacter pacificus]|uniref:Uncharacterized protein n=1 Tax=Malaciobacter pacificus TaxID=1080223 RepID=A0A5C2HEC8_9BACT|nr:hypothetical protein [Malaciobacter pacificus]QEP34732.1 hypothetical protein APAC_1636 [Malaciobacter pacificus]GGD46502.1 hypothetical protein GCM10012288_20940 [Malaciobacter pacificus]
MSKRKILLTITAVLLLAQTIHLHLNKPYQNIEIDLLTQVIKEKYENNLKEKQKAIKESKVFKILQTDLKIPKDAKFDLNFIWNEEDKKKANLENGKEFDSSTLANLVLYHDYIREMYKYTKNLTIIESYVKMMTTINTVLKQTPSVIKKEDIDAIENINKEFQSFRDTLDSSLLEVNEFDKKIIDFFKNSKDKDLKKSNIKEHAKYTAEQLFLIIEMLQKSDNLYINLSVNESGDPFLKFQGFLNIYNNTYKLYSSLIQKHNKEIEKNDYTNTWITTILSLLLIFITFYKEYDLEN